MGSTTKNTFYSKEFKRHATEKKQEFREKEAKETRDEFSRWVAHKFWGYKDYKDFLSNFESH